jgi:hypothetical protein
MQIWMSNSRSELAYEREFFAVLCNNLIARRGVRRVAERFQLLAVLASLPWLDQPRALEPTRLIFEIHEAWEDLWALHLDKLGAGSVSDARTHPGLRRGQIPTCSDDENLLGKYLARPLHDLAVFAASAGANARVRAATHPKLIASGVSGRGWRVIQGGRCRDANLPLAGPETNA